ncbi:MAG: hypothetical protein P4L82_15325 [Ancalomicrobiaceae bacterium]|nr:hypothetical protein [Ancalomicrobiaceae bacterium]
MRVDAHQHFSSIARRNYRWLTPAIPVFGREHESDEIKPSLSAVGVGAESSLTSPTEC